MSNDRKDDVERPAGCREEGSGQDCCSPDGKEAAECCAPPRKTSWFKILIFALVMLAAVGVGIYSILSRNENAGPSKTGEVSEAGAREPSQPEQPAAQETGNDPARPSAPPCCASKKAAASAPAAPCCGAQEGAPSPPPSCGEESGRPCCGGD